MEIAAAPLGNLLDQAQAGSAEAFCDLARVYENRLLRQAMALCGEASQAEELAQDALVEAWKSLHRYNGRCQFFTWLCAILLNRYRHSLRAKHRFHFFPLSQTDPDGAKGDLAEIPDHDPRPDEVVQVREQTALVLQCIRALPAKQQEVIYLRFYVDQSLDGIAEALGCPVGTVKSRLFHALDRLRSMNALNGRPNSLAAEKAGSASNL